MTEFALTRETLDLPQGAWAQGWRTLLSQGDRLILGLTQGPRRACLYPILTPRGHAVTSESPGDHPHHNSIWVASDHVHARMITGGARDDLGTYNFYVDDVFQGRAPGTISETAITGEALDDGAYRIVQTLTWRGPREWAAPNGRSLLVEKRVTEVIAAKQATAIDISTTLTATDWELTFGPTRHALFGVRLAEAMSLGGRGRLIDATGREGAAAISGGRADWIDYSGPVGGGQRAGIAVLPAPETDWSPWFATDWGTIAVNPIGETPLILQPNASARFSTRLIVHDGIGPEAIDRAWQTYRRMREDNKVSTVYESGARPEDVAAAAGADAAEKPVPPDAAAAHDETKEPIT